MIRFIRRKNIAVVTYLWEIGCLENLRSITQSYILIKEAYTENNPFIPVF